MNKRLSRSIVIAGSIIMVVFSVLAYAGLNRQKTMTQEKSNIIKNLETEPDQLLRVIGNDDCPLRIVNARVKEVSNHTFEQLTGSKAKASRVMSAPEVNLVNVSGKTITEFTFFMRNPNTKSMRMYTPNARSIAAGEVLKIPREHFGGADRVTSLGKDGKFTQKLVQTDFTSEKKWLNFGSRDEIYSSIGKVTFQDGTTWLIKEEGDVK